MTFKAAARMLCFNPMSATFYHLQINVSNLGFYRALFDFLGYRVIAEGEEHFAVTDGHFDLWVMQVEGSCRHLPFHRKAAGFNHLALRVSRKEEVDRFCKEFLEARGISALYDGAKEYPEYQAGYYAVYFEDPDRMKLEIVFIPGK